MLRWHGTDRMRYGEEARCYKGLRPCYKILGQEASVRASCLDAQEREMRRRVAGERTTGCS